VVWTFLVSVLGSAPVAFAAATNSDTSRAGASPSKSATTNAAPAAAPLPQSVFVVPKSRLEGVDPFFPLSRRLDVMDVSNSTNKTFVVGELVVKGFSGTTATPLVIINDRTFGVGDEKEVVTAQGRARVRCIEIHLRDESVIIEANSERRELRFRSGK